MGLPGDAMFAFANCSRGKHLSEERFFSPQTPLSFQRLLLPLSRAASAAPMRQRSATACAVRDSGNKSLWKERGVWGERRTFPQKGVLSPQTVRKGEHCNSQQLQASPRLRKRQNFYVFAIGSVLASRKKPFFLKAQTACPLMFSTRKKPGFSVFSQVKSKGNVFGSFTTSFLWTELL